MDRHRNAHEGNTSTNMEGDTGKHIQTHRHTYRSSTQVHTDMKRDIHIQYKHTGTHRGIYIDAHKRCAHIHIYSNYCSGNHLAVNGCIGS